MRTRLSVRHARACPSPLLGPLPSEVVLLVLRLLPLDARLRAREVSRGLCALLEDVRFWTHVDLGIGCGVNPGFLNGKGRTLALLRAACVRATGKLQSMYLWGVSYCEPPLCVLEWLDSVSAANKASLRDLVAPTHDVLEVDQVTLLCRALPVCRVRCAVECDVVEALPLLRRKPPYELLSIGKLRFFQEDEDEQALLDLASALSAYKGMEKLNINEVPLTTRAVDALVDAAVSAGIKDTYFGGCSLSQTALPALTRLIQSPGFERLRVRNDAVDLFGGPAMPAFCEALRNSKSLRVLELEWVNLWADSAAAYQLIAAIEGHSALHELKLRNNPTDRTPAAQQAAGECLARLIAQSSSLRGLDLSYDGLGEAGLEPFFQALRSSTGLVKLIFGHN